MNCGWCGQRIEQNYHSGEPIWVHIRSTGRLASWCLTNLPHDIGGVHLTRAEPEHNQTRLI